MERGAETHQVELDEHQDDREADRTGGPRREGEQRSDRFEHHGRLGQPRQEARKVAQEAAPRGHHVVELERHGDRGALAEPPSQPTTASRGLGVSSRIRSRTLLIERWDGSRWRK